MITKQSIEKAFDCEVNDFAVTDGPDGEQIVVIKVIPKAALQYIDVDLVLGKSGAFSMSPRKVGTCHCGKPVDTSNPDCEAYNLCRDHVMDC